MIKGVSKNVIEISDTGNDCFERAILFLRADAKKPDKNMLKGKAKDYLSELRPRARGYSRARWWVAAIKLAAAAGVGAAFAAAWLQL